MKGNKEGKRAGLRTCRRQWQHLQESFPCLARWPASHSASSKVGLHRGKEGLVLTSVATGRCAGVGEEMVDAVKRKVTSLVGEAEKRHSEEEGDAR
jgi:hypothetical protein